MKQNVLFQLGICPENCKLDQIQKGRLAAIINFNKPDIWQTVPNRSTITMKQNVRFQVVWSGKIQLHQIQKGPQ